MTTYTVLDYNGYVEASGLLAADAADLILCHDGAEYEIRASGSKHGGYDLWSRKPNANRPWTQTVAFSLESDFAKAEAEIFEKVIYAGWTNQLVMTDDAYAVMEADLDADDE
jgi:hypothetical protein